MLEKGINARKWFGDFKSLENKLLKDSASPNADISDLLSTMKRCKANLVKSEIMRLKMETNNLWNTITNKKREVQIITDEESYLKWRANIEISAIAFKTLYSQEANELFDHFYKMDRVFEEALGKIVSSTMAIIENVCVPSDADRMAKMEKAEFLAPKEEDELMNSFINSSGSSKGDDSGFASYLEESAAKTSEKWERKKENRTGAMKRKCLEIETIDEFGTVEISMSQIQKIMAEDDK